MYYQDDLWTLWTAEPENYIKKGLGKKDYTKTVNTLYICENCEQITTASATAVGRWGSVTEVDVETSVQN